ncbi:MAG: carboxypeptidase-like regulatory domain-containing protein, partial [Tepidisphaeraceae bacterium]
ISGTVTNAQGQPVAGVLIQSGATHWVTTDANGNFTLPGLINGARTLTATYGKASVSINLTMSGSNIQGKNFTFT